MRVSTFHLTWCHFLDLIMESYQPLKWKTRIFDLVEEIKRKRKVPSLANSLRGPRHIKHTKILFTASRLFCMARVNRSLANSRLRH